jgi:hypothetical protein
LKIITKKQSKKGQWQKSESLKHKKPAVKPSELSLFIGALGILGLGQFKRMPKKRSMCPPAKKSPKR